MYLVSAISTYLFIIPFFLGIYIYKISSKELKILTFYLGAIALTEAIARLYSFLFYNNLIVYHFFDIIEFSFVIYSLYSYKRIKILKFNILWIIPIYLMIYTALILFGIDKINSYTSITGNVGRYLLIIFLIVTLIKISLQTDVLLVQNPFFWVLTAFLSYFSFSIILFLLFSFLTSEQLTPLFIIQEVNNTITYGLYTFSYIILIKNRNLSSK